MAKQNLNPAQIELQEQQKDINRLRGLIFEVNKLASKLGLISGDREEVSGRSPKQQRIEKYRNALRSGSIPKQSQLKP